jgi:hypothetical protein
MKLSQIYLDFDVEQKSIFDYIKVPENKDRLNIDDTQVTKSQELNTEWVDKLTKYSTVDTHTPGAVKGMQMIYDTYHAFTQGLKRQIKNNQAITLTEDDYKNLYIHEDMDPRSHVPRPVISPENSIQLQTHQRAQIFTYNPNPPFQKEVALPADVKKIGRKIAYTKIDDPCPDFGLFHALEIIGSTVYDIIFSEENVGQKAWLKTCYMNARGEEGPWSVPLPITIV